MALQGKIERYVYFKVYEAKQKTYSDQTSRFPFQCQRGYKYIMVMVEIDSNVTLVAPTKNRKYAKTQRAYLDLFIIIKQSGIALQCHIIENERSESMDTLIRENYALGLVPPHCHQRNVAEVSIRSFKQHSMRIISGMATDFPMHQWERLLPQAKLTLNILGKSNTTTTVSAHASVFGPFNYNRMPLGLRECTVFIHKNSGARASWGNNAVYGWCLYTSLEHYRAHMCRVKKTNAK